MKQQLLRLAVLAGLSMALSAGAMGAEQPANAGLFPEHALSSEPLALEKATFGMFGLVDNLERKTQGQGIAFLRNNLQLSEPDALAYLQYLRNSLAASRAAQQEQVDALCASRAQYSTPESLATALNDMEQAADLLIAQLARGSRDTIGNANQALADTFVSEFILPGQKVRKPNHLEIMRAGTSPAEVLNRICNR